MCTTKAARFEMLRAETERQAEVERVIMEEEIHVSEEAVRVSSERKARGEAMRVKR